MNCDEKNFNEKIENLYFVVIVFHSNDSILFVPVLIKNQPRKLFDL